MLKKKKKKKREKEKKWKPASSSASAILLQNQDGRAAPRTLGLWEWCLWAFSTRHTSAKSCVLLALQRFLQDAPHLDLMSETASTCTTRRGEEILSCRLSRQVFKNLSLSVTEAHHPSRVLDSFSSSAI